MCACVGDFLDMDYVLGIVAVLSSLTAMISAWLAYQSNCRAANRDRARRVRELSFTANKVVAATIHIDDLANQLKTGYRTLFTFAGQGPGGSQLKLYVDAIEEKQRGIGTMQTAARETLENGFSEISEDQINELLLKYDGYLAHLDRVREKFHVDLASVESQTESYRQERIAGLRSAQ